MGTLFRIKLYTTDQQSAESAFHSAFARIAQLDNALSDYKPDSELNMASKAAASGPVHISDDLAAVLKASQQLSEETGGAFDVTIGPLTKLWRRARKDHRVPYSEEVAAVRERCGYRKLHLDPASQTMTADSSGMELDLGAIAKGYAADQALDVISRLGIRSALVAASGDLAFGDSPPGETGWKIGLDSLDSASKPFTRVLILHNAAVSTSGNNEQFLESNGKRFSHIIDPKTGTGLTSDISVTAVAKLGIQADPAATAVSVLGREKGLIFIENHPGLAAFILETESHKTYALESTSFTKLVQDNSLQEANATTR